MAERYDRTLEDAFAIQSEVAQQIVAAVGAVLTSVEQGRLTAAPTANAEAYRLYLQGREYWSRPGRFRQNIEIAQQLYERALALDPNFALAHAALSHMHGPMYWFRYDPSVARAARQREEAEVALRLAPNLPQAHFAMGLVHYFGRRDYRRALHEFAIALKGLPSDAQLFATIGYVHRRLGNWDEVSAAFEKAAQLNPRYADLFSDLGGESYLIVRRYADAVHAYDRALSLAPDLHNVAISRGWTYVVWQGQLDTLRAVLSRVPRDADLGDPGGIVSQRAEFLLWERDADSLLQTLQTAHVDVFDEQNFFLPGALYAASCTATTLRHGQRSIRPACVWIPRWAGSRTTGACMRPAAWRWPGSGVGTRRCGRRAGYSSRSTTARTPLGVRSWQKRVRESSRRRATPRRRSTRSSGCWRGPHTSASTRCSSIRAGTPFASTRGSRRCWQSTAPDQLGDGSARAPHAGHVWGESDCEAKSDSH